MYNRFKTLVIRLQPCAYTQSQFMLLQQYFDKVTLVGTCHVLRKKKNNKSNPPTLFYSLDLTDYTRWYLRSVTYDTLLNRRFFPLLHAGYMLSMNRYSSASLKLMKLSSFFRNPHFLRGHNRSDFDRYLYVQSPLFRPVKAYLFQPGSRFPFLMAKIPIPLLTFKFDDFQFAPQPQPQLSPFDRLNP
uniref:Uncharacterized protein n=1 Tax=Schistocephalus solidus TaxID=70667 RepID=A0A0X3PTU0_SCHSO